MKLAPKFVKLPPTSIKLASEFIKLQTTIINLSSEFIKLPPEFMKLPQYFIKLEPKFVNLLSYFTILPMKFIIQTKTPAPQEKAHLQSAIPAAKPKTAKELFLSISLPSLKKNKFPTPTPEYFQTN